jgi:hypothetical protein
VDYREAQWLEQQCSPILDQLVRWCWLDLERERREEWARLLETWNRLRVRDDQRACLPSQRSRIDDMVPMRVGDHDPFEPRLASLELVENGEA